MKKLICLISFMSSAALANDRFFTCDAIDGFGTRHLFEINMDAIEIKKMEIGRADWQLLYSAEKFCSASIKEAARCEFSIQHNFNVYNAPCLKASFEANCYGFDNRLIHEVSGVSEINEKGGGAGFFKCGKLANNALELSNCKATSDQ